MRRDIQQACYVALKYMHQRCRLIDHERVSLMKVKISEQFSAAPDSALLLAAQFLNLIGKTEKAKTFLGEVLQRNPANMQAKAIRAWTLVLEKEEASLNTALVAFNEILDAAGESGYLRVLDSCMGLAKLFEYGRKYEKMVEIFNDILSRSAQFVPALIEKSRVQMMIGDWEEIEVTAQRILAVSPRNIEALRIWIFYLLSREANYSLAVEKIEELSRALTEKEPKNAKLYLDIVKPFVRICGRREEVLRALLGITQAAKRLEPEDSEILTELGFQLSLLNDFNASLQTLNEATAKDPSNLEALYKILRCKIMQGGLLEAQQQIEFLTEIESTTGPTSELAFLTSMVTWRQEKNRNLAIEQLDGALSLHVSQSKSLAPGYDFYTKLNPDYLLELAKEYLQHVGLNPLPLGTKPPAYLTRGIKLLETVTKQIPGIIESHLLLAKAKYVANEWANAQKFVSICLTLDPSCVDALMLGALISMQQGQYISASGVLDQALARNFKIRENPVFMLVKGKVEMKQQKYREAMDTLEKAYSLPEVKNPEVAKNKRSQLTLTLSSEDRASLFTNLALAYSECDKLPQARQIINEAISEFAGTSEEVLVLIANSELNLKQGELKRALNILNAITPEHARYKEVQVHKGEIFLNHMTNRRLFAKCYYDIVSNDPNVENQLLLGKALMRIQEPEEAITVYEKALERMQGDLFLTREIGKALVLTHDYDRAVQYYQTAMSKDQNKAELLADLANLFLRLNNSEAAMKVLNDALSRKITDMPTLRLAVKSHHLMCKVILHAHKGEDPLNLTSDNDAASALQNAISLQKEVISRGRDMPADQMEEERKQLSGLLYEMGEYCQYRAKDLDNASGFYTESITYQEMFPKPIIALAKLNLRKGDYTQAAHYCNAMLRIDPSNEEATNMIAELLLQQNQVDQAITHYSNLLKNKPDNYMSLSRLLQLLRRAGRVEDIDKFIQQAEASRVKGAEAGLAYCKGLAAWFKGSIMEALELFNKARNNALYGKYALSSMITAYLNPENDPFWTVRVSPENLAAAAALFEELNARYIDLNTVILECYYKIISGRADQALTQLQTILTKNPSYVPGIVAAAIGMLSHNKSADVRNTLKNLNKIPYFPEFAEDFERGWLLLAHIYSDGGNPELATELLSKCLKYNANCSKAEELLGQIYERKQNHADACRHYEKAWQLNMSGSIGYRLAFNYLKAKRYVKAVDICRAVLKKYPDYPQIQTEVLARARASIRL